MSHAHNHCSNGSPADACDDLRWLAYRYASGDLSEEECAAFEERMAADAARGDVRLCQLVAEVVALDHAVRTVESQVVESAAFESVAAELTVAQSRDAARTAEYSHSVPAGRRAFAMVGAVASVAVACVAFLLGTRWNAPVESVVNPNGPATVGSHSAASDHDAARADRLVSLWRQSQDDSTDGTSDSGDGSGSDVIDSDARDDELSWDSVAGSVAGATFDPGASSETARSTGRAPGAAAGAGSVRWSSTGHSRDGDYVVPAWLLAAVSADEMDDGIEQAIDPKSATLPKTPADPAPRSQTLNPVKEN